MVSGCSDLSELKQKLLGGRVVFQYVAPGLHLRVDRYRLKHSDVDALLNNPDCSLFLFMQLLVHL